MEKKIPIEIKKILPSIIKIKWNDGLEAYIKLAKLRSECPCAECKGETIGTKKIMPKLINTFTPGMNELKTLNAVGNYALTASWGDGHDTGIYTYDLLREISEKFSMNNQDIEANIETYHKSLNTENK